MNPMVETIQELTRWYDLFNEHYFENKLPPAMITVQKTRQGNLGHFTPWYSWVSVDEDEAKDEKNNYCEINLAAQALNRPAEEIGCTMVHEMTHYDLFLQGVKNCSGKIHNKKFKAAAESHDMIVERDKKVGWGVTMPNDNMKKFINDVIKPDMNKIHYFREDMTKEPKAKELHPVYHVFCESCGKKFDYKPKKKDKDNFDFMNDFGFVCKACGTEMQIEEDEA